MSLIINKQVRHKQSMLDGGKSYRENTIGKW